MHLKSVTLRGFKSFASSTTLEFEPGITCIVGPNGSGKSNVVDALAWVMGEQGVKSLRGGKMEDVIFAGTAGRPPLGRSEVVLTIDNADGALPIEYAEVTIARTMFRQGGSEYAINGQTCRLLDVQELLSDSGIGREMHVIVGQGRLDAILRASPEERRGFIEEAAGVLKHRKRKEKAVRKLDATDTNLTRLSDLLGEIRRQLKPLGRQAEVAKRASVVQMDARDARARLLADDVVQLRDSLRAELADEAAVRTRRAQVEADLGEHRARENELDTALRSDAPLVARAQETWFALSGLRERVSGTARQAGERLRNAADEPLAAGPGRDPEELEAQATEIAAQEETISREVHERHRLLDEAVALRQQQESAYAEEDRQLAGLLRGAADRREGLARLTGQVNSVRSRAAAADDEIGRLTSAHAAAIARAERAQLDFTSLETRVAGLDAGERGLDAEHEGASTLVGDIDDRLAKLHDEAQRADRERAALLARREALELGLSPADAAGALLASEEPVSGLLGSLAALLSVRPGYEAAVAAALGSAANGLAMQDAETAAAALTYLEAADLGRCSFVIAGSERADVAWPELPDGASYAVDLVAAPDPLRPALHRLLFKTVVVDDLGAARALVGTWPDLVAVTRAGDQWGAHLAAGGSSAQPSLIELQAAVDEAARALDEATADSERLRFEVSSLQAERADAQGRVDVALAKLHESDATLAAVAEQLGQYGSLARSARAEAQRLTSAIADAVAARDREIAGLGELQQRLLAAQDDSGGEPDTTRREELSERARLARQAETDARLALRTSEERARALRGRAEGLLSAAQAERQARALSIRRELKRRMDARIARAVATGAEVVLARLERSLADAHQHRTDAERVRLDTEQELSVVRSKVRALEAELSSLTDDVHRDELLRAEHQLREEQLAQRALDDLGLDLDALVQDYGPDQPIPWQSAPPAPGQSVGEAGDIDGVPTAYVREEQLKRLRSAERALSQLGRINPLALEEFSALEERHQFLTSQLEDLRKTRRDLLDIVKEVDARVEQVLAKAYADVAVEFAAIFARLFPGGHGELLLTDPDQLLTSGVEVEARPPGKKIKRLSLLSGGERSLVAVAFLVALFKARPSPFYILDEVEAALDDTNLGRLLEIYEELRETSQLIVITHQKRTMEVADALYGVSMRGDGVSTLISQRLRESA